MIHDTDVAETGSRTGEEEANPEEEEDVAWFTRRTVTNTRRPYEPPAMTPADFDPVAALFTAPEPPPDADEAELRAMLADLDADRPDRSDATVCETVERAVKRLQYIFRGFNMKQLELGTRDEVRSFVGEIVIDARRSYDPQRGMTLASWITTRAKAMLLDRYRYSRRNKRKINLDLLLYDMEDDRNLCLAAPEPVVTLEDKVVLEDAMLALRAHKSRYHDAFKLHAVDGLSHKEIAEALSVTEGASAQYVCRARKWLQQYLEGSLDWV